MIRNARSKVSCTRKVKFRRRDETAVRVLAERTSNGHSFEAYLLTECANSQTEREPQGGEPLLKWRCGESNKQSFCLTPHLFSQSLTAQALFTLKIRRARTQIAIPCECLLGEGVLCTQAVKRTLIRSVLINGMCLFED